MNDLYFINVEGDWHTPTFEGAQEAGITIKEFDIERQKIRITINTSCPQVAEYITENWGHETQEYKLAKRFLSDAEALSEKEDNDEELTALEDTFMSDLGELFLNALKDQYEYLMSDEAIAETFEANEYTFLESGKMFNASQGEKIIN
ncbi:MAG TPA: hypothetical protein ACFYEK_01180 [Candidatus Wunengus sp. YC60]|uniref:hypothetical protein n=1 Tax=Candidatus Wunengus sp. YC60 TaxID=3367697 RepID=UPI0040269A9A